MHETRTAAQASAPIRGHHFQKLDPSEEIRSPPHRGGGERARPPDENCDPRTESSHRGTSGAERRAPIGRLACRSGETGGPGATQGAGLSAGLANWRARRGRGPGAPLPGPGENKMAAAGGGPRFSAPPSPASLCPAAALAPGQGFARPRPARKVPRFPPPPAQPLVPVGPAAAAPAPAPSGPAAAPITSATGPAPTFGDPGRGPAGRGAGRRGPGSGARPPPALASAATACPLPARAGAPARPPPPLPGEEGEWSRRCRRRHRHGARPRGGRDQPPGRIRPSGLPPPPPPLPSLPPRLRGLSR